MVHGAYFPHEMKQYAHSRSKLIESDVVICITFI